MHKKFLFRILSLIIAGAGTVFSMQAFSTSKYATTSKLANGKWVKIAIPEDGIYQLTFDELSQMGFSNPQNVRLYGQGGHPISELLDGNATDDLKQIPFKVYDNKICFYACGPVKFTMETPTSVPHFTRDFNSYSTVGYYFITENDGSAMLAPTQVNNTLSTGKVWTTSRDYMLHERDLVSPGQSGREFMGESMDNATIDIPYSLPGLCGDSAMTINICAAAKVTAASYIAGKINNNNLNFTLSTSKIYAPANSLVYYNFASPFAEYKPTAGNPITQDGVINANIYSPAGQVNTAWLNYIILTYCHDNTLSHNTVDNQLRMAFPVLKASEAIALPEASATTEVWNVSDPQAPISYTLTENGNSRMCSPVTSSSNGLQFIAFDPALAQKSISGYSQVENQNIHGLPTPDMIIVTTQELLPQAERIAQMHRDNDNIIVHVLDQQQVFNEFSSGTPDAMALRLMNKMFYDRNSTKFKNLLMMGAGSYDNRQIIFKKDINLITYESVESNDEEYSYVCDDFFGMLDDNSGSNPESDYLRLGVGRIPSSSLSEAQSDVDKLLKYVNEPDYGPWRNDLILIADEQDNGLHAFQAEGVNNILIDELSTGMTNNKVYISQFPNDPTSKFAFEARKSLTAQLKQGQYFMDYVGHAGPSSITKENKLWNTSDVKNVEYNNLPIYFTACCDVARYDGNTQGIMEMMFHKPGGGAIALVTSARAVYAEDNDQLNQAFVKAMFCFSTKGYMPTLGEAYMLCKQSFGRTENYNKMSFFLMGDPAIKVNYPKPYFKITKVNNQDAADAAIATGAMRELTVEAKVFNPGMASVNTSFNGDATLSVYGAEKQERSITMRVNRKDITRDIYYPRQLIARATGRVENGIFTGKVVLPRYITSLDTLTGAIKVYAHQDDTQEMVNGGFYNLAFEPYDQNNELTVVDNMPPVIEQLYFNDEQLFNDGAMIPTSSTLYIKATDDYAFNMQSQAIGNSMTLQLDGGKTTYPYVKNYSAMAQEGKTLAIEFPMSLQNGKHTLTFTIYDAAGNKASRTISFMVGTTSSMEINVEEEPATEQATFNITTDVVTTPPVTIKVVDNVGELVWSTTTSNFPYSWDLKDSQGNRVPAGVYRFFGTYNDGINYGGTSMKHLIVIDPHKTSN